MAVTHGMNPDEVERLGNELQARAADIETMLGTIAGLVRSTTWNGPDATMFKDDWWPGHEASLRRVATDLNGFGQSALNNARAQRDVSQG